MWPNTNTKTEEFMWEINRLTSYILVHVNNYH